MEATEHVTVNIQMIMYGAEFANSLWSQARCWFSEQL